MMFLKKIVILVLLCLFIATTATSQQRIKDKKNEHLSPPEMSHDTTKKTPNPYLNLSVTSVIIKNESNTYGYDIAVEGKTVIHQPNVPAISGNQGFKTKESAELVAKMVIKKIKNGEMPPTISIDEMKKIKAL
jgi:Domain of unknown function (DUF4907)